MQLDYDIIAVDDDTIEHEIMIRALRKTTYQIKCFEYTDEAYEFLQLHQPRHLFVDYRMPDATGIEFIERLAGNTKLDKTNIYLTSNSSIPDAVLLQVDALGAQFLLKEVISSPGYLVTLCNQEGNTTSSE